MTPMIGGNLFSADFAIGEFPLVVLFAECKWTPGIVTCNVAMDKNGFSFICSNSCIWSLGTNAKFDNNDNCLVHEFQRDMIHCAYA